jgi:gamma-glutamyl:cysteine ligase YbdK (ATP-grasp superfamily)
MIGPSVPRLPEHDSGLASVRPVISRLLPRQGVPRALRTSERFAAELA